MPAIVLVGAQWGDEGKGKATDLLGDRVDYVVRYQGGNNAGHTVVIGEESYALHMLGRAAAAIGEADEARRCEQFLRDSSATAAAELDGVS